LLISGYCENDAEERSRFPLLPKPFSVTSLLQIVHDLLSQAIRHTAGNGTACRLSAQMPDETGKKAE